MYCKKCGKEIPSDSMFCKHCGSKQDIEPSKTNSNIQDSNREVVIVRKSTDAESASSNRNKVNSTIRKSILGFVLISLFALIALFLFKSFANPTIADPSIDRVSNELADACKKYDEIGTFHCGLARVKKGEKWGFIDKLGKEIIPCSYDMAYSFKLGYCVVEKSEKEGIIDQHGKEIVPIKYESTTILSDTTFAVKNDEKCCVVDSKEETIVPYDYLWVDLYTNGFYVVRQEIDNGVKYGLVEKSTKELLNSQYFDDLAFGFNDGLCAIKQGEEWKYIDTTGKIVIDIDDDANYKIDRGQFRSGYTVVSTDFDYEHTQFAFISQTGYIATDFMNGSAESMDAESCYWIVNVDPLHGKRGLMKMTILGCEWILPPFYQAIYLPPKSVEDEIAFVERDHDTWYMVDLKTGKALSSVNYEVYPNTYSDGLVLIKKNGLYGWMNTDNIVIPCIYNDAEVFEGFSEGFAVVNKYGKWGYVDKYGNDTFSLNN